MAIEEKQEPATFEARWRKRFEGFADNNDDDAGIAGWSPTGLQARLRNFERLWVADNNNTTWLDVGCGAGTYSRFLASHGVTVVGMDYCVSAVQKATLRDSTGCHWCAADVRKLPAKPETFDGILCFGVIQALADSDSAVGELAATVRRGGELWIDALNGLCLPHLWERLRRKLSGRAPHVRYETPRQLMHIMKTHGLENAELFWIPILPSSQQRFQWLVETPMARWMFRHVPMLGALLSHAFLLKARRRTA